jgi:hypothetical protein
VFIFWEFVAVRKTRSDWLFDEQHRGGFGPGMFIVREFRLRIQAAISCWMLRLSYGSCKKEKFWARIASDKVESETLDQRISLSGGKIHESLTNFHEKSTIK